jgi:hypothetical protein
MKSGNWLANRNRRFQLFVVGWLPPLLIVGILLVISFIFASCNHLNPLTIAPREVISEQPSFDANTQNSGVISADKRGFIVTAHFLDRHGLKHGSFLRDAGVTDAPNGNFRITGELMARCIEQDRQRKNKQQ